jgi:hypothetical protein
MDGIKLPLVSRPVSQRSWEAIYVRRCVYSDRAPETSARNRSDAPDYVKLSQPTNAAFTCQGSRHLLGDRPHESLLNTLRQRLQSSAPFLRAYTKPTRRMTIKLSILPNIGSALYLAI